MYRSEILLSCMRQVFFQVVWKHLSCFWDLRVSFNQQSHGRYVHSKVCSENCEHSQVPQCLGEQAEQ